MEGAQKPSRMTRRMFIALSGSAAAVTVVAVRSPSAPAQTAPAAAPTKGVELKFAMVAGYKADGTRSILPKFEQATGIKVVQDDLPYAPLHEKLALALSGKTKAYDVFFCDEGYVPQLAAYLYPLEQLIKRDKLDVQDFVPITMQAGQWKGKQVSLPMDSNVPFLFYRKDLLQAKGLKTPDTWQEVMETAKKLTDPGKEIWGWAERGKRDVQVAAFMLILQWSWGNEILTPDYQVAFDNDQGLAALEFYKELFSVSPPGSASYAQPEVTTAAQLGKVAMFWNWASTARSYEDPKTSKVVGKMGQALVPRQKTRAPMRGIWTMAMPADIEPGKVDAAWTFIKWMTGKEGGLQYALAGSGHPVRESMLTDPKFKASFPYADVQLQSLKIAKVRPFLPETAEIMSELEVMGSSVAARSTPPKDALKKAAEGINGVLKRAGYR